MPAVGTVTISRRNAIAELLGRLPARNSLTVP